MLLFPQGSGTTHKLFNASVGYSLLKLLLSKRLNQIFLCAAFQSFLPTTERIPLLPAGIMHSFDCWVLNRLHSGKKIKQLTVYHEQSDQTFCERT